MSSVSSECSDKNLKELQFKSISLGVCALMQPLFLFLFYLTSFITSILYMYCGNVAMVYLKCLNLMCPCFADTYNTRVILRAIVICFTP